MTRERTPKEIGLCDNVKEAFLNCRASADLKCFLDGYDITGFDRFGNNILHYYLKNMPAFSMNWREVIPEILGRGLDIDQKQSSGNAQSPLHIAVRLREKEIADYLIGSGADIDSTDANGNTVIWTAVMEYRGDGDLIETLLNRHADARKKNNAGVSAIKLAKTIANYDIGKYFQ